MQRFSRPFGAALLALALLGAAPNVARAHQSSPLEPARFLPERAVFVIGAGSIDEVYRRFGFEMIPTWLGPRLKAKYERAVKRIRFSPLSRRGLTALGLDVRRGAALAVVSIDRGPLTAVIVPITSGDAFIRGVTRSMGHPPKLIQEGPVRVIRTGHRERLIVRKRWAIFLIASYRAQSNLERFTAALSKPRLPKSLADSGVLKRALDGLGGKKCDGFLWLNAEALTDGISAQIRARIARHTKQMQSSPQPNDWRARYVKRQRRFLEAFELIARPFRQFVIGAQLSSSGIQAKWRMQLRPKTYVSRLLKGPFVATLPRLLWPPPTFGSSAHIDPKELLRLILAVAQAGAPDEVKQSLTSIEKTLGKTLDQFVGGLLDGHVESYLTLRIPSSRRINGPLDVFDVHVTLGLRNPTLFRQLLNLATSLAGTALVTRRTERYAAYGIKLGSRTLELAQIGKQLVITSDRTLLDRLASGGRVDYLARWAPKTTRSALSRPTSASGLVNVGGVLSAILSLVARDHFYHVKSQSPSPKEQELEAELREIHNAIASLQASLHAYLNKNGGLFVIQGQKTSGSLLRGTASWEVRSASLTAWTEGLMRTIGRFIDKESAHTERRLEIYRQLRELRRSANK
ncbi:MAG: hypothetical protein KC609_12790 [Myxococcales bacterium]|nr:hypothetical protein [Myxococcales bacterium]